MKTGNLALFACLAALTAAHTLQDSTDARTVRHHRRHHARRAYDLSSPLPKRASVSVDASLSVGKKCSSTKKKAKKVKPANKKPAKSPSKTGSNSSSSSGCPKGALSVKGVCIGMLPDGGSDGGPRNTMSQLNSLIASTGSKHAYYGQYAQARGGSFDGNQLLQVMDDVKESGAIFQPAVMPVDGWAGLTPEDDSLARQICTVMKKFTDEGIEVWLRFAHEVNWYQTDGTYQGNADDFKKGWNAVGKACKEIAPEVKMFLNWNWADMDTYRAYYPGPEYLNYVGTDMYPKDPSNLDGVFLSMAQGIHDEWCKEDGPHFAMGETGLHSGGSAEQKLTWLKSMVDAKEQMPHLTGISWFNYIKSENGMDRIPFKVCDPDDSETTSAYLSYLTSQ